MKKIFIALSVLAALTFGVGSALAVPGAVDNVPGTDFTVPFLVSDARVTGGSGPTTLLNFSEVRGFFTEFHIFFFDRFSGYVADAWFPITHWGTVMRDVAIFIQAMSDSDRARLLYTHEGQTFYAGYIEGENYIWVPNPALPGALMRQRGTADNIIGSIYMLNLSQGMAAASNLPMREFFDLSWADLTIGPPVGIVWGATQAQLTRWAITGRGDTPTSWVGALAGMMPLYKYAVVNEYETFTPAALAAATDLVWNNPVTTVLHTTYDAAGVAIRQWRSPYAAWFRIIPEYYILDATGMTYFMIWQNGMPNGTTFHMYVINDYEDYLSTTIPINEVTFINAIDWIPSGLMVTYPYSGIFNWTTRDTNATGSQWLWAEWLGWNWQYADSGAGAAATNWQIMKEMARDVGTLPDPFTGQAPDPVHF